VNLSAVMGGIKLELSHSLISSGLHNFLKFLVTMNISI
jgi:hypothetical protein